MIEYTLPVYLFGLEQPLFVQLCWSYWKLTCWWYWLSYLQLVITLWHLILCVALFAGFMWIEIWISLVSIF